ncbi:uncharacterized protein (DUF934 family) [Paucimonas lemoignei]|uniref:Uncharacterized protein (DUF934 family) n=1 Tax=Paucimonas lemoignei TaxID=29443 RepID=A0A4R3HSG2_PAULE|nr:DUF934 domain-containing protein [Paucimonas lemoignei]TCS34774.1 uncharacterized protein (DUF934 family) [Paucimonas lemoignei]
MANVIKIIKSEPQIVEDAWTVVRGPEATTEANTRQLILPIAYLENAPAEYEAIQPRAVWIAPDDEFESLAQHFHKLDLIAVDFPSFRDGRGYSIGYLLRTRYKWQGELRAIGDVLRDQLNYMRRCGFDSFAVRADKNIHDAVKSFSHYSVQYQGAVDQPLPLFRRR